MLDGEKTNEKVDKTKDTTTKENKLKSETLVLKGNLY